MICFKKSFSATCIVLRKYDYKIRYIEREIIMKSFSGKTNTESLDSELSYEIRDRLDMLLKSKFNCNDEKIEWLQENSFLSNKVGFSAVNLIELFVELEKEFQIKFSRQDIKKFPFDSYYGLVAMITKKVRVKND